MPSKKRSNGLGPHTDDSVEMTRDVDFSEGPDGEVTLERPGWDRLMEGEATGQEVTIKARGRNIFRKPRRSVES